MIEREEGRDYRRTWDWAATFSGVPGNGLAGEFAAKYAGSAEETGSEENEAAGFGSGQILRLMLTSVKTKVSSL